MENLKHTTDLEKISNEIKTSLFNINEIVVYYNEDKHVRNSVVNELRKIQNRIDKINAINKATK
jgi:hypothetical protein